MFKNNINGNKKKIKINQKKGESSNVIVEIIVGVVVTLIGGIILYFVTGS